MIPYLTYTIEPNPDFGKIFTIADVEKSSEDDYGHVVDNLMTLGRPLPEYEEWAIQGMQYDLELLQQKSKAQLIVYKFPIACEADLENLARRLKTSNGACRFVDNNLNKQFDLMT